MWGDVGEAGEEVPLVRAPPVHGPPTIRWSPPHLASPLLPAVGSRSSVQSLPSITLSLDRLVGRSQEATTRSNETSGREEPERVGVMDGEPKFVSFHSLSLIPFPLVPIIWFPLPRLILRVPLSAALHGRFY